MGSKGSKNPAAPKQKLSESDYKFLVAQTGLSRDDIKKFFDEFMRNNPDGLLDQQEFVRLYDTLRPEPRELIDEISVNVFNAFDKDRNGKLSFQEFLVAYALTSRGDQRQKLDYAFTVYDADHNGYLDQNELNAVLTGMLDLLGADKRNHNSRSLAQECARELDVSHDGRISKDEFINGLLKNYSLRALMSPFN